MILESAIPEILPVTSHTDFVGQGSTFVAIKGKKLDGSDYIMAALQKGAQKIVLEENTFLSVSVLNFIKLNNIDLEYVNDARKALADLSAQAWGFPADKLKVIGITGTKGKTTSTFLTYHILTQAGYKTAMISGVKNIINGQEYAASLTTPQPDYLHAFLNKCVEQKVEYVVMEVSAQAFTLHRLSSIKLAGGIFTNLSFEHMEFYSSMDEYFFAKCEIFNHLATGANVVLNLDNSWAEQAAINHLDNSIAISFDKNKYLDYLFTLKRNDQSGIDLVMNLHGLELEFESNLVGDFNAYNVAGVIALCNQLGINLPVIQEALKSFTKVPGRMERYALPNGAIAVIDYAHNPSSFSSLLPTLKSICSKLIVVFGAGGDRDKQRRPLMGDIASSIADTIIITSDNPRSENLKDIIDQIYSGVLPENQHKVTCEPERTKAIAMAYKLASDSDIIAILGKGPDEYEIVGDNKFYFSDKETVLSCSK